jgi:hypothetical protein
MRFIRRTLGYTLFDHKRNELMDIMDKQPKITPIINSVTQYRKNWKEHVRRMTSGRIPKMILKYNQKERDVWAGRCSCQMHKSCAGANMAHSFANITSHRNRLLLFVKYLGLVHIYNHCRQTMLANVLETSFVRVCKQSANKYSVFLISRCKWKARYNVCKCGRVSEHVIRLSWAIVKTSAQNGAKRE